MADLATKAQNQSSEMDRVSWTRVQLKAAQMLGQGMSRAEVAKKLNGYLLKEREKNYTPIKARAVALRRLRSWQRMKRFRDLQWEFTVAELDAQAGAIAMGVARRGKMGRVDAGKFSLELAGRYTPKGHDQPTAVQIIVGGVPRPQLPEAEDVIDGELTAEE